MLHSDRKIQNSSSRHHRPAAANLTSGGGALRRVSSPANQRLAQGRFGRLGHRQSPTNARKSRFVTGQGLAPATRSSGPCQRCDRQQKKGTGSLGQPSLAILQHKKKRWRECLYNSVTGACASWWDFPNSCIPISFEEIDVDFVPFRYLSTKPHFPRSSLTPLAIRSQTQATTRIPRIAALPTAHWQKGYLQKQPQEQASAKEATRSQPWVSQAIPSSPSSSSSSSSSWQASRLASGALFTWCATAGAVKGPARAEAQAPPRI